MMSHGWDGHSRYSAQPYHCGPGGPGSALHSDMVPTWQSLRDRLDLHPENQLFRTGEFIQEQVFGRSVSFCRVNRVNDRIKIKHRIAMTNPAPIFSCLRPAYGLTLKVGNQYSLLWGTVKPEAWTAPGSNE